MKEWEKAYREWGEGEDPLRAFKAGWHKAIDFIIQNADGYVEGIGNQKDMVLRIKASLTGEEEWWKTL